MPVRESSIGGFAPLTPVEAPARPAPTGVETIGAAFGLENDVLNAWELFTKPGFKPDPLYDNTKRVKESKYWDTGYRDNFLGVKSDEEFNYISAKIEEEERKRDVYARSGWGGVAAMVGASLMSPTMFIPLMGPSRGVKAIGEAALLAGGASVAAEIPLALNQETRTTGEIATSLAASTVLGGILGGAVSVLRKGEYEALEEVLGAVKADMAIPRGGKTISETGVGAQATRVDPGRLAKGAQTIARMTDSNPVTRSPVTYNIESEFGEARWTMAQLSDGGLTLEGAAKGIPPSVGGTAENAITPWNGRYYTYIERANDAFARYQFDGNVPTIAPNLRATLRGFQSAEKLSRKDFNKEVFRAAYSNDTHPNPFVAEAAQTARKEVLDPLLEAMLDPKVQFFKTKPEAGVDPSYITRLYNHEAIRADPNGFVDMLEAEFEKRLQDDFAKLYTKYRERQDLTAELLEDIERPADEIETLRDIFVDQLKTLEADANTQQLTALEDTIASLRAAARQLKDGGLADETMRKQMLADARDMATNAGEPLAKLRTERSTLKRRLSNLNKAAVVVEERLAKKLEKIERSEELSMNALNRAARAGYKFLSEMENWTDEVLDEKLSELKTSFERTAQIYDRGEERLVKLAKDEAPDLFGAEATQLARAERMTDVAERIADAEDLGRPALREMIDDMLQESLAKVNAINSRRAVRTAKLREQAKNLDPLVYAERIEGIRAKGAKRTSDMNERLNSMRADSFDLENGTASFRGYSHESAHATKAKILGTYLRLPVVEMMQDERGSALPRLLSFIETKTLEPWLETDIEKVLRSHLRTMAPDIEIARRLGSVNGEEQFMRLGKELDAKVEAVRTEPAFNKKGEPIIVDGKPKLKFDTPEKQRKEVERLQATHKILSKNQEANIKRLRNQWGLPSDPDGMGTRMAKSVMNLNVLRYMGGVTISSIPDVARPIMRYGITRAFRDGFIPMITSFKEMKLSVKEARRAGVGIDAYTSTHSQTVMDIMDDLGRGTKFERGLEYATQRQGLIAGFSYWTDWWKGVSSAIANAKFMDSIADVAEGKGAMKDSVEFLATNGIDAAHAERIYAQSQKGHAAKVNDVWLPNTEDWDDAIAVQVFRTAVAREANNTIITPGLERPLWTNETTAGKMASQFKSFAFASTQKTLMAGLQQRDAAFVTGATISLAMGAFSYYVYSVVKGGETYEKMLNADLDTWADEAYQRSGLTGVLGLVQDIGSRIPATAPYMSFSGGRSTRRGGDDLTETLLGPSFDFMKTASEVITGLDDPTKSTVNNASKLLPYQNTHVLGMLIDAIVEATPVKENRQ